VNPCHHLVEPVIRLDYFAQAAAEHGEASKERFVNGPIDPDREDAQSFEPRTEGPQNLILVPALTVGQEDQHWVSALSLPAQQVDGTLQRLRQLGAAASFDLRQPFDNAEARAIGRLNDLVLVDRWCGLDGIVERQDADAIAIGECVDHSRDGAPRSDHLPASHTAGAIEHEHDVAGARRRA
jgi:hypothetical protein